jgi:hypothetical protein
MGAGAVFGLLGIGGDKMIVRYVRIASFLLMKDALPDIVEIS